MFGPLVASRWSIYDLNSLWFAVTIRKCNAWKYCSASFVAEANIVTDSESTIRRFRRLWASRKMPKESKNMPLPQQSYPRPQNPSRWSWRNESDCTEQHWITLGWPLKEAECVDRPPFPSSFCREQLHSECLFGRKTCKMSRSATRNHRALRSIFQPQVSTRNMKKNDGRWSQVAAQNGQQLPTPLKHPWNI